MEWLLPTGVWDRSTHRRPRMPARTPAAIVPRTRRPTPPLTVLQMSRLNHPPTAPPDPDRSFSARHAPLQDRWYRGERHEDDVLVPTNGYPGVLRADHRRLF